MEIRLTFLTLLVLLSACGNASNTVTLTIAPMLGQSHTQKGAPDPMKSFYEKFVSPATLSLNSVSPTQTCVQTHLYGAYKPGVDTQGSDSGTSGIKIVPLRLRMPICTSTNCDPANFNLFESLNLATIETPVKFVVPRNEPGQIAILGTLFPPVDNTRSPGDETNTLSGSDDICDPKAIVGQTIDNATLNYSVIGHRDINVTADATLTVNTWFVPSSGSYTLPTHIASVWNPGSFNCPDRNNRMNCSVKDLLLVKPTVDLNHTILIQSVKLLSDLDHPIIQPLSHGSVTQNFIIPHLFPMEIEVVYSASSPPTIPGAITYTVTGTSTPLCPFPSDSSNCIILKDLINP